VAIAFELVANFGSNDAAASAAYELVVSSAPLAVGRRSIELHEPLLHRVRGRDGVQYLEMSVLPVGVGWGVGLDSGHEPLRLTAAELTELGHGLYRLPAGFAGYRAAQVGWDPECWVDLDELRQEYADDLADGTLSGLVLAEDVLSDLRGPGFRPFAPGFVWAPYAGERPSTLTSDEQAT
jgi:hypothetical protein